MLKVLLVHSDGGWETEAASAGSGSAPAAPAKDYDGPAGMDVEGVIETNYHEASQSCLVV